MSILDTCEFARYAPAESTAEMDRIYNETLGAIGKWKNKLKKIDRDMNARICILSFLTFVMSYHVAMAQEPGDTIPAGGCRRDRSEQSRHVGSSCHFGSSRHA